MARTHGRLLCSIWDDGDWTDLGMGPQWLYERFLSDKAMNHAGVITGIMSRRWSRGARNLDVSDIEKYLSELADARFVVVDYETEEVFVRSLVRRDGIADQPNVLKAALADARQVSSRSIRSAMAAELRRLPAKRPDTARMRYPDPHAVADEIDPDGGPEPTPKKPNEKATGKPSVEASSDEPPNGQTGTSEGCAAGQQPTLDGTLPETDGRTLRGRGGGRGGGTPLVDDNSSSKHSRASHATEAELMLRFDEFYAAYPRRKDRLKAEKAWRAAIRRGVNPQHIIDATHRYAEQTAHKEARYVSYPASWLNAGSYDNEPEAAPLRLVSGGYVPWQNPADQSAYDEPLLPPNPTEEP